MLECSLDVRFDEGLSSRKRNVGEVVNGGKELDESFVIPLKSVSGNVVGRDVLLKTTILEYSSNLRAICGIKPLVRG